ncbi:FadR/GntR family transcriptional regulator [Pseudonocardia sichuanensis]
MVVTSVEQALRVLVAEGIQDGTMGPGVKLPTERALVERLAAPRGAIRRALDVLEREGLVVRHVGRGTFLTDEARRPPVGTPADTSPAEIVQVRLAIEPAVAALAARAATQADLDRIGECLDGLRAGLLDDDFERQETWDLRLHRAIAHATHNGLLVSVCEVMFVARELPVWGSSKRRVNTAERRRGYHRQHTAIVEALRDRDPDSAEIAMRIHLQSVSDNLLGRH